MSIDSTGEIPEPLQRLAAETDEEERLGVTYFIQHTGDLAGPIKIGRARSVHHRMRDARDFPFGIRLVGCMLGDHEKQLHQHFKEYRIQHGGFDKGREWFHPTRELLQFIQDHAAMPHASREAIKDTLDAIRSRRRRSSSRSNNGWSNQQIADALNEAYQKHQHACTSLIIVANHHHDLALCITAQAGITVDCTRAGGDPPPCLLCEPCWINHAAQNIALAQHILLAVQIHQHRKEIILHLHHHVDPTSRLQEFQHLWEAEGDLEDSDWTILIASHNQNLWTPSRFDPFALDTVGPETPTQQHTQEGP